MRLLLPEGLGFRLAHEQVRPYRAHVTLIVFDEIGREVARQKERYDTDQRDEDELAARFQKWIDGEMVLTPVAESENVSEEIRRLGKEIQDLREGKKDKRQGHLLKRLVKRGKKNGP